MAVTSRRLGGGWADLEQARMLFTKLVAQIDATHPRNSLRGSSVMDSTV